MNNQRSLMLCLIITVMIGLLLGIPALAAEEGIVKGTVVNLRTGAGQEHSVVTQTNGGQGLSVIGASGDWLQVVLYNDQTGWIHKNYVEIKKVLKKIQISGSYINLRTGPSTAYARAGQAVVGTVLPVFFEQNGWYKISAPGVGEAWIAGWLTKTIEDFSVQTIVSSNTAGLSGSAENNENIENAAASATQGKHVRVKTKVLNVRQNADINSLIVGKVYDGDTFRLEEEKNSWYLISKGTIKGWVSADYTEIYVPPASEIKAQPAAGTIQPDSEIKPSPLPEEKTEAAETLTVTGSTVNIRKEPNTVSAVLVQVKAGDKLGILEIQGEWIKGRLADGTEGWIAAWLTDAYSTQQIPVQPIAGVPEQEALIAPMMEDRTFKIIDAASRPILQLEGWSNNQYKISTISAENKIVIELDGYTERNYEGKNTRLGLQNIRIYPNGNKAIIELVFIYAPGMVIDYDPQKLNTRIKLELLKTAGLANRLIVLDPGHASIQPGGWLDPGAIGKYTGIKEKDINLDIALKLRDMLQNAGARVIMTHTGQTSLSLAGRANIANSAKADIFVSIHANYSLKNSIAGHSTYYYAPAKDAVLGPQRYSRQKLAVFIQREMSAVGGRKNIGTIEQNFAVLRETTVPSVLVETAYLSDAEEEALLSTDIYRRTIAAGIYNGIRLYFE